MKNDYQQKKDGKDLNLSYSQNPNPAQKNQSIEFAAKNSLNQSRSINPHQSNLPFQNPNPSQPNFRIGALSNNVSREYSAGKKKGDLNMSNAVNVSHDERSKQNAPNVLQGAHLGQRRSSKIVLSRNLSLKGGSPTDSGSQYPRIGNGQSDYNLLGNSGRDSSGAGRGISLDNKKTAHVEFKFTDPTIDQRFTEEQAKPPAVDPNTSLARADISPKATFPKEKAVVHWADCLNGQDIRTELKFGDCLGQGSFAKVYEGFDKRLKIPVAIKVIDKRKIKDTETKKKALIEEEIYIFCRMDHPNIVKFIRLIEDVKRVILF